MAVRSTMAALIARVRSLINDPSGASQVWDDQTIQDVLDASRMDLRNETLKPVPTFSGTTIQYLDYFHSLGDWEDDYVLKQFLTVTVTPSSAEPIVGHWTFAATTLPPVFLTGKTYDVYRAAADLLERWSAKWVLSYSMTVDGQNLQRSQVTTALQALARTYRAQQRAHVINTTRTDLSNKAAGLDLAPREIDLMGSGDGR